MNRSQALIPAVIALGGVLMGFALGALSCGPGPSTGARPLGAALSPPTADPNLEALLEEVRALGERISELVAARPMTAPSAATPSHTPTERVDAAPTAEITRVLDRCAELVERLERRTKAPGHRELSLGTPGASREKFLEYDLSAPDTDNQLHRDHLLLSYQQILDRYGAPDSVSSSKDGSVFWLYSNVAAGRTATTWHFTFLDGLVMRSGGNAQ